MYFCLSMKVKQHKGRIGIWFILLFFCATCYPSSLMGAAIGHFGIANLHIDTARRDTTVLNNSQARASSAQRDNDTAVFFFSSKEQALDTLIAWLLMKKPSMNVGYVTKTEFIKQWRSHDTTTLKQVVEGTWLTYQFKFKKSLLKTQIKMKQSKVNFKMVEVVPRPRVTVSSAGDGITKYDYIVKYKKLKYVLSFQLWWIDGQAFWVNEVSWMMGV